MLTTILLFVFATLAAMQLSALSTTIYLHRTMAHKGLRLHPAVAFLMQLELWMFTGIVTREWVAVHRKHHHFTDEEGDPHSPHLKGLWRVLLWNAIYYAREANRAEVVEKYTKDMPPTRTERLFSRGSTGIVTGVAVFVVLFYSVVGGWQGALLGGVAFITQAVAYVFANAMINGACHVLGYKNFNNTATNLRWVAWFTAGEGLHNNHHQYPSAAKLSVRRTEVDPAWAVIRILTLFRLAEPLPLPQRLAA